MQMSKSPIYLCWASATQRGAYAGTVHDFIEEIGEHKGPGYKLTRIDLSAPLSPKNHCWVRISQSGSEKYTEEGFASNKNEKCPYSEELLMERCGWLAGHYDRHGKLSWELARQL